MTTPKATQARERDRVNDMANGSGRMMSEEASVNIGALQQRVFGLESSQRNLADGLSNLASRVETLFAGLATKIEERSRPQYPLLISLGLLGLAVVSSVGWLAYAPIRDNQTDLKAALIVLTNTVAAAQDRTNDKFGAVAERFASLGDRYVTIRELDNRSSRTTDERKRLEQDVNGIQKELVPRAEHAERWRSVDKQFEYQQRQLDERKRFESDMISVPSFLKDINERVRAMEIARAKGTAP